MCVVVVVGSNLRVFACVRWLVALSMCVVGVLVGCVFVLVCVLACVRACVCWDVAVFVCLCGVVFVCLCVFVLCGCGCV